MNREITAATYLHTHTPTGFEVLHTHSILQYTEFGNIYDFPNIHNLYMATLLSVTLLTQ